MDRSEVLKKEYRTTALMCAPLVLSPALYFAITLLVNPALSTPPEILRYLRPALFFLGGPRTDFYGLAAYSGCLLVLFFPRFSQWEGCVQGSI